MALIEMASPLPSKNLDESMEDEDSFTESVILGANDDISPGQQETVLQANENALLSQPIAKSLSGISSIGPEPEVPMESESGSNVSESGYNSEWEGGSGERKAHRLNMATTPLQVFLTNMNWYRMHTNDSMQPNEFMRKQKKKRNIWITVCVISCLILIVIGVISVLLLSHAKEIEIEVPPKVDDSRHLFSDPRKLLIFGDSSDRIGYQNVSESNTMKEILKKSTNRTSADQP